MKNIKRILAMLAAMTLVSCSFASCELSADKDKDSKSSSSDEKGSDLDDSAAKSLKKAAESALSDLEADGEDINSVSYITIKDGELEDCNSECDTKLAKKIIKAIGEDYDLDELPAGLLFFDEGTCKEVFIGKSLSKKPSGIFSKEDDAEDCKDMTIEDILSEKEDSYKVSSGKSDDDDDDDKDKDDPEEETTEDTEEETTEEPEEETTKKASGSSSGKSDKELLGSWYSDDKKMGFSFNSDSSVDLFMDISEQIYFSGETLYFQDTAAPAESITLNGDELSINIGGTEIMTLQKKESREGSDYYGEYAVKSGMLYKSLPESSGDILLTLTDGASVCTYAGVMTYSLDGSTMKLTDSLGLFGEKDKEESVNYEVSGDELTLDSDGEKIVLKRWEQK